MRKLTPSLRGWGGFAALAYFSVLARTRFLTGSSVLLQRWLALAFSSAEAPPGVSRDSETRKIEKSDSLEIALKLQFDSLGTGSGRF